MKERVVSILRSKDFLRNIAAVLIIECLLGIFIAIKGGNIDYYLGVIVPFLAVMTVAIVYSMYMEADYIFTYICILLLQIGVATQCILQKEAKNFCMKENFYFCMALSAAVIVIIFHQKILPKIELKRIVFGTVGITISIFVVLLLVGKATGGVNAWITIKGLSIQPTEGLKIVFIYFNSIIFCVTDFTDKEKMIIGVAYLMLNLIGFTLIGEMGTFLILCFVFAIYVILLLHSNKVLVKLGGSVLAVCAVIIGIGEWSLPYVKEMTKSNSKLIVKISKIICRISNRISYWVNPDSISNTSNIQMFRANEAMSLGGWFGSKYYVQIPVEQSDYIFPAIILRFGVVMACVIVILFLILLVRGILIYLNTEGKLETGIVIGSVYCLVIQAFLMIFGSSGYFMMTGVPLSFLSNGGTALVVEFMMAALIITFSSKYYNSINLKGKQLEILKLKRGKRDKKHQTGKKPKNDKKEQKWVENDYLDI